MDFTYKFPAVKGIQAGSEYYITMIPLNLLNKLFIDDTDNSILPEFRAQRKLNESRIPEISNYILDNRRSYVFSALSASIDGDFNFIQTTKFKNIGLLEVDMHAKFLINDGQHRKAAIEKALLEDPTLKNETIAIVFFKDDGLKRSQQMFTDLNKHAVKTSNSISTLYDNRDPIAVATREVVDTIPFFKKFTDKERDNLGKNSSNFFTLNNFYKANKKIMKSGNVTNEDLNFLVEFWRCVVNNIVEWKEVENKQITKKCLRENYVINLAVTINAFGRLGSYFRECKNLDFKILNNLRDIDWLRNSDNWKNRIIRSDGKVIANNDAALLTCNKIKLLLGIKLTKEEKLRENALRRK